MEILIFVITSAEVTDFKYHRTTSCNRNVLEHDADKNIWGKRKYVVGE
jgi:hypothetical protein